MYFQEEQIGIFLCNYYSEDQKKELQLCTHKKSNHLLFKTGERVGKNIKIEMTNTKAASGLLSAGSCLQVKSIEIY